jgi:hypothetical protein
MLYYYIDNPNYPNSLEVLHFIEELGKLTRKTARLNPHPKIIIFISKLD